MISADSAKNIIINTSRPAVDSILRTKRNYKRLIKCFGSFQQSQLKDSFAKKKLMTENSEYYNVFIH